MIRIGKVAFVMVAAGLFLGCDDKNKHQAANRDSMHKMKPATEEPAKSIDRILEIQAANGARNDATLYPSHFDGGELNALGRSKLALLMRGGRAGQPTVVYLDLGRSDQMASARHTAVDKYWRESMSGATQLEIRDGMNASEMHLSRDSLSRMSMTNSNPKESGTSTPESGGAASGTEQQPSSPAAGPQDTLFK